jgi:hypothetical protein
MFHPSPLEYAPRPSAHQRVFGRLTLITVLSALVVLAWWWAPSVWPRLELVYWQYRCMAYAAPPNQVIFDSQVPCDVVPKEWSEFYRILSPPGFKSNGTVFLHGLNRPDGVRRLVAVDVFWQQWSMLLGSAGIEARVFIPGGVSRLPTETKGGFYQDVFDPDYASRFQIRAGHLDPADQTHFTFTVTTKTSVHLYEGWLKNDDTVVLGERTHTSPPK